MRTGISILTLFLLAAVLAGAQVAPPGHTGYDGSRFDFGVGYQRIQANAPPGICNCFGNNGGFANASWWVGKQLAITGEFTGDYANNISSLGQNLTLITYMGGPHYAFPIRRLSIDGEFLMGLAHASNSYFPSGTGYETSASSFGWSPGGDVDFALNRRFAIRIVQARYLHTSFPNGTNNEQNQLMIGAGLIFRFRHEAKIKTPPPVEEAAAPAPPPPPPPPPPSVSQMSCASAMTQVQAGATLEIAAVTQTTQPDAAVQYSWTTSGGQILGDGARITVNTSNLPPGEYHVTGHGQIGDAAETGRSCDVVFEVIAPPPPPPPPAPASNEADFNKHVHDVFFDLNKSNLRADAEETLRANAAYLIEHPNIHFGIQGYADARGSSKYNLALGERRVQSVKDELINLGVSADRMQVVTFGRDAQICTASDEVCFQQNRRVGFIMRP